MKKVNIFELVISLASITIFFALGMIPAMRVGDGSEYYAMSLAWESTFRPWMSPESYATYDSFFESGLITGLLSSSWLQETFSTLNLGTTSDYGHFWLYSFLAFIISTPLEFMFSGQYTHQGFVFLHAALITTSLILANRQFGWKGITAIVILVVSSPLVWFSNKVHTEFFTFSTALIAVMFYTRSNYLKSALFLAMASTQNPSFAILAVFALGVWASTKIKQKLSWREVFGLFVTITLIFLLPSA
jgi:hypothetical protein